MKRHSLLQWSSLTIVIAASLSLSSATAKTVALWLFDDPRGSPVAVDSSGNGFHLTLGPDAAISPDGKFGGALDADATPNDGLGAFRYHAEKPLNPGEGENWTLECWAKAKPDMAGDNRIWGLSGINYIDMGRGNDRGLFVAIRFLPIDRVTSWNKPTGDLKTDGGYHHLAFVYDSPATELRHYYDGKLKFTAKGKWKSVETGEPPYSDVVFPPHYPMLQIGMRDALQQWDHRELHAHDRLMKKFQGWLDEVRFSNEAIYNGDRFAPPDSFARPALRVWPQRADLSAVTGKDRTAQTSIALSTNRSGGSRWKIRKAPDWLKPGAAEGKLGPAPTTLVLTANISQLPPGRSEGVVELEADDLGSFRLPVTLTVIDSAKILDIGDRKQLFIDQKFIEHGENVALHTNAPQKIEMNFVLNAHYPRAIIRIESTGVWRMYHSPFANLRYAESTDGFNWKQSGPDEVGYESEQQPGNLLPLGFLTTVFYDPRDVPERRFKAFQEVTQQEIDRANYEFGPGDKGKDARSLMGIYAFYSADGLRFKKAGRVFPLLPEFVSPAIYWEEKIQKYVFFDRCQNLKSRGLDMLQGNQFYYLPGFSYDKPDKLVKTVSADAMAVPGYENLRAVFRLEIDDLLKPWPVPEWAEAQTIHTTAAHVPQVLAADKWDGFSDMYAHATLRYPWADDVYLAFPTMFRHFHPSRQPWFYKFDDANGPLEVSLAVSRDGINWDRVDREAYVPMGRNDQKDRWRTMMGVGMVRVGNDLYQYYWLGPTLHDSVLLRPEMQPNPAWDTGLQLMAVRQRLDGFVSANVDYQGGSITTPPIVFKGNRLQLNHTCGALGTIFVELRDLADQPIPGYALADCEEIACDDVAWEIRWRGSGDVSQLAGRAVKLHFKMQSAKLYAFQFLGVTTR